MAWRISAAKWNRRRSAARSRCVLLGGAVGLDPRFAAWWMIGHAHMLDAWIGWSTSPRQSLAQARALAEKAIAMDESLDEPYVTLAMVYQLRGEHEGAVPAADRAVALQPDAAGANAYLARILTYAGRPAEAIEAARKAMRLAPRYQADFVLFLGRAYRAAGRCEQAIGAYRRGHELNPSGFPAHSGIAVCYRRPGREAEARAVAPEMLKAMPSYSLAFHARVNPYRNPADLERDLSDVRALGFK
ncbi:MAG: tetratricopeptide repeat protein [Candidatus Rokubacteria bacterium]|nr:tetratricopeptide repeat protein [Candidatus Rokubacteria bacterium]